jgi:hypothetical protein
MRDFPGPVLKNETHFCLQPIKCAALQMRVMPHIPSNTAGSSAARRKRDSHVTEVYSFRSQFGSITQQMYGLLEGKVTRNVRVSTFPTCHIIITIGMTCALMILKETKLMTE